MLLSISELTRRYADGTLTPNDVLDQCLDAIDTLDPVVGAWQAVYSEEARAVAQAATDAIADGAQKGPRTLSTLKGKSPQRAAQNGWTANRQLPHRSLSDSLTLAEFWSEKLKP